MTRWSAILAVVLLAGCARFEPRPLSPIDTAARFESRSLADPGLKAFLETHLHREFTTWPLPEWDFDMLTLAAMYYHPSLEVARAKWGVATAAETTAAQRPNPTLNVVPGYDTTTSIPSPWIPSVSLDVPIETAGKRGYRRDESAHLADAARLSVASTAWEVRSGLRTSLLDFLAAQKREALLKDQLALQEQVIKVLEEQQQAGAITPAEAAPFRIAFQRTRLDSADAQRLQAEARARTAEAMGVPLTALDVRFAIAWLSDFPAASTNLAELRRAALQSRPDLLQALAQYAAAQSALQLEIAKQYPDLRFSPGYQYDQGDNKWSLGLSLELPILSRNQGPIAEAKARRQEAAAHFNALQAKVLAEIERATEVFEISARNVAVLRSLAEEQAKRRDSVEAQFQAGATDKLERLNAQLESATAQLLQLEGQVKAQQAFGGLENAFQRPLGGGELRNPMFEAGKKSE